MDKKDREREGNDMALLARPIDGMIKIDKDKTSKFLEDTKKNTIKPEFLKQCQRYAEMLNNNKQ